MSEEEYGRSTPSDTDVLCTMVLVQNFRNDSEENYWEVSSILNAVLSRVTQQIPIIRSRWVVTNNDQNYQNDFVTVIAGFIRAYPGLDLRGFEHSETARGKSVLNAHVYITI